MEPPLPSQAKLTIRMMAEAMRKEGVPRHGAAEGEFAAEHARKRGNNLGVVQQELLQVEEDGKRVSQGIDTCGRARAAPATANGDFGAF
jgi:hypothetical protein